MRGLKTPFSKQNTGTQKFSCDHIKNAPYVLLAIMLWGLEAKLLPYLAIKAKSNYDKYDNKCLLVPNCTQTNVREPINALVSGLAGWQ